MEIRELDPKVGEERKPLFDSKLLEDLDGLVPDTRHARGRKK